MGGNQSTIAYSSLNCLEVADLLSHLGPAYESYKKAIIHNGLDGAALEAIASDEDEFITILKDLEVTKVVHQKVILSRFFKQNSCNTVPGVANNLSIDSESLLKVVKDGNSKEEIRKENEERNCMERSVHSLDAEIVGGNNFNKDENRTKRTLNSAVAEIVGNLNISTKLKYPDDSKHDNSKREKCEKMVLIKDDKNKRIPQDFKAQVGEQNISKGTTFLDGCNAENSNSVKVWTCVDSESFNTVGENNYLKLSLDPTIRTGEQIMIEGHNSKANNCDISEDTSPNNGACKESPLGSSNASLQNVVPNKPQLSNHIPRTHVLTHIAPALPVQLFADYQGQDNFNSNKYRTIAYSDGTTYTGEFLGNLKHGFGRYTWDNYDFYEGAWALGKRSGKGVMKYVHGDAYFGNWKDDMMNDYGVYKWMISPCTNNGDEPAHGLDRMYDVYSGSWKKNMREGKGSFEMSNGDVYSGDWEKDEFSGRGEMKFANGDYYEGEYRSNMMNGKGKFVWVEANEEYSGDWMDSYQHGIGLKRFSENTVYEGEFVLGQMCGRGKYTYTDGAVTEVNRLTQSPHTSLFNIDSGSGSAHVNQYSAKRPRPEEQHSAAGGQKKAARPSTPSSSRASNGNFPSASKAKKIRLCGGCGNPHTGPCAFYNHPNYNKTKGPWSKSQVGIKLKALGHNSLTKACLLVDGKLVQLEDF